MSIVDEARASKSEGHFINNRKQALLAAGGEGVEVLGCLFARFLEARRGRGLEGQRLVRENDWPAGNRLSDCALLSAVSRVARPASSRALPFSSAVAAVDTPHSSWLLLPSSCSPLHFPSPSRHGVGRLSLAPNYYSHAWFSLFSPLSSPCCGRLALPFRIDSRTLWGKIPTTPSLRNSGNLRTMWAFRS